MAPDTAAAARWVVYDNNGVIAEGSEDDARTAFTDPGVTWVGDLVLARIEDRRR